MSERNHAVSENGTAPPMFKNPGKIMEIMSSRLTSGLGYQRGVSESRVKWLISHWMDELLEPVMVSKRDGKFNIIDGQNRVLAIRRMHNGEDRPITCLVFEGLTYEDEANLCYLCDLNKKRMTLGQSLNALLQSGRNPHITDIDDQIQQAGFIWMLDKYVEGPYRINVTREIIKSYHTLGHKSFRRMLDLLKATWEGDSKSLCAMMISGMTLFLKTYETQVSDDTFIQRMKNRAPRQIISLAQADFSTNRNSLRCSRVLVEFYNKGVRRGKKLNPNLLLS